MVINAFGCNVPVTVGDGPAVWVGEAVNVLVAVDVRVGVTVDVTVGVMVAVTVGVMVAVTVGVIVCCSISKSNAFLIPDLCGSMLCCSSVWADDASLGNIINPIKIQKTRMIIDNLAVGL
jgi:hypothetical protein